MNLFALVKTGVPQLGTNPVRYFEFGTAPTLATPPYATWQELTGTPLNFLEGRPSTDSVKVQIDVWATTATECRTVARAIRRALDPHGTFSFYQNSWDEESRLCRSILHYNYNKGIDL